MAEYIVDYDIGHAADGVVNESDNFHITPTHEETSSCKGPKRVGFERREQKKLPKKHALERARSALHRESSLSHMEATSSDANKARESYMLRRAVEERTTNQGKTGRSGSPERSKNSTIISEVCDAL